MNNIDKKHIPKDEMDSIRRRLLIILNKFEHGHKLNFSKNVGSSSGNVEAWFSLDSTTLPGFKALRNIAKVYLINLNWLILGEGPMRMNEPPETTAKDLELERLRGELSAYQKILGKRKN